MHSSVVHRWHRRRSYFCVGRWTSYYFCAGNMNDPITMFQAARQNLPQHRKQQLIVPRELLFVIVGNFLLSTTTESKVD